MGTSVGTDIDILSGELLWPEFWLFLWHAVDSEWSRAYNYVHYNNFQFIPCCCFTNLHICSEGACIDNLLVAKVLIVGYKGWDKKLLMVLCLVKNFFISILYIVRNILPHSYIYSPYVFWIFTDWDIEQDLNRKTNHKINEIDLDTIISCCCTTYYY